MEPVDRDQHQIDLGDYKSHEAASQGPPGSAIDESIFESNGGVNQKDNVKVCIRIRPLSEREKNSQVGKNLCIQQVDAGTIVLDRVTDCKNFNFDFVGGEGTSQATIFNAIAKPIADSCMQGYNGTIFAYG
jgi:hypothetical protein